ncbi:MAG: purine-nucleoside phosphorylase [Bacilli bacterium]|nr:purine-nucleoside phosphorylase [Bacilli bacterium]
MTPHIEAKKGEIAKTVLMPGDPLRAKYIAETYLENYTLVNSVRGMYAYTGNYKNKKITVMASGMGMPSIGIYSYELYKFYDVENIIRLGSAGSYSKDLNIYDVLLVNKCYSESSYAKTQNNDLNELQEGSKELNNIINITAKKLNRKLYFGNIHSSDVFYKENNNYEYLREKYGCLAVEMESFALFHNAKILNKKAACLLTISDSFITKEETTSLERQNSFNVMIEIALESSLSM